MDDQSIKIDNTTSLTSKGKFARICVEVDITKPLLSKFTLSDEVIPIEYEGLHLVCFDCGVYGHKKGQCGVDNPTKDLTENPTRMDRTQEENNAQTEARSVPPQPRAPAQSYKENYGAWMLVMRKEKRGRSGGAGNYSPSNVGNRRPPANSQGHQASQFGSRYAILGGVEDIEIDSTSMDGEFTAAPQYMNANLPRIRTHQQPDTSVLPQGRGGVQFEAPQERRLVNPQQPNRGAFRGRGGRGGAPRRAAAELEHIVVRGHDKGKQITSIVVLNSNDSPEASHMIGLEYGFKEDPPDLARVFTNRREPPYISMRDNDQDVGSMAIDYPTSWHIFDSPAGKRRSCDRKRQS